MSSQKYYEIFDMYEGLSSECPVVSAETNLEALKKYLKVIKDDSKIVRSGGNLVRFKVTEIEYKKNIATKKGRAVWYKSI